MIRVPITVMACALLFQTPAMGADPSTSALTDEAIAKVKAMSYRSDKVDWPALESTVRAKAEGAKDIVDLLPALDTLVRGLGDNHSFVNASAEDRAEYKTRHGREFDSERTYKKATSPFTMRRGATVKAAPAGKGSAEVLTVPFLFGGGARANEYAQTLYDGLSTGASKRCGYVVDLRGNGGGNVWPMLTGLAPLLGEPWNGYDLRPDGRLTSYATVWRGKATIMDKYDPYFGANMIELANWKPLPALVRAPVAVLIDDAVGSSGEGVTLAFQGRPNTRTFGTKTAGVASSNEGFMLADRVNIVVTTGLMIDRFRRTYPNGVTPDQATAVPASADSPDDPTMHAALDWLGQQPGCA